jgi:hypothetical protein
MIFDTPTTANNAAERISLITESIHSSLEQVVILAGTADTIFKSVEPYANTLIDGIIEDCGDSLAVQLGTIINNVAPIDANTAIATSLANEVTSRYGTYTPLQISSINGSFSTFVTAINSYDESVAKVTASTIENTINNILPPLSKAVRVIPAVNSSIVAQVVANTQIRSGVSVIIDGVRNGDSIAEISTNLGQQSLYSAISSTRTTLSNPIVNPSTVNGFLTSMNNALQSLKGKV